MGSSDHFNLLKLSDGRGDCQVFMMSGDHSEHLFLEQVINPVTDD